MADYSKIKLIVLDVDGTLTDSGIYYDSQGQEIKRFDVKDGLGIKVGIAAGLEFAIITGRESPMVARRAAELGIQHLVQGAQRKTPALLALMETLSLGREQVAYMGDDLNDLAPMGVVGVCACPEDADEQIRSVCHYVAPHAGGHGAVRAFIHDILNQQGIWEPLIQQIY